MSNQGVLERAPMQRIRRAAEMVGLIGVMSALGVGIGVSIQDRAFAADVAYHATGQRSDLEQQFTEALRAVQQTDVAVRCADTQEAGHAANTVAFVHKVMGEHTDYVRVEPSICETASKVIGRTTTFKNTDELNKVAFAVATLAHEGEHIAEDESTESIVECYATQDVAAVASSLGASVAVANQLGNEYADNQTAWANNKYDAPPTCYDGGPLDLDPTLTGDFPYDAPVSSSFRRVL
jgi:hypothetical protein